MTAPSASRFATTLGWVAQRKAAIVVLFFGVCLPLLLFGHLADEVMENERIAFDLPIQTFVHGRASPTLDQVMLWLSRAGSAWMTVPFDALIAIVLLARQRRRLAAFWLLAVGGAAALNAIAKQVFSRERPALWISPAPETTFSFPSGHSMQTSAVVAGLVVLCWHTRWRVPVAIAGSLFMLGVGLSRVYLGVHYPSDVIAAWVASIGWVIGLAAVLRVNKTA